MPYGGAYSARSPGELRTFSFDFFGDLDDGDSLASASTTLSAVGDSTAPLLLVGSPAILGGLGAYTSTYDAWVVGNVMNVTSDPTCPLTRRATVAGAGVAAGTTIVSQLSGVSGGVGAYEVNVGQSVPPATMTSTWRLRSVVAQQIGTNNSNPVGFLSGLTYVWAITAVTAIRGDKIEWTVHIPIVSGEPE